MDPFYTANKHGVVGWTRAMGPALEPEGIRFNAVCPGFAESALVEPLRDELVAQGFDIIPAESVAETVVRLLASDRDRGVLVRPAPPRAGRVRLPRRARPGRPLTADREETPWTSS